MEQTITTEVKKIMRLKHRNGVEECLDIGGLQERVYGYDVKDTNGNDLGYFGPDKYESITFEAHFVESQSEPFPR